MNRQPNYKKVYEEIKATIINGEYEVGSLLPPEPALEALYQVSRTTIRKAIDNLSREGFVHVKQGRGTEVLDYITMQNLNHVSSFSKTLIEKGFTVEAKSIYIDRINASASIARKLCIQENDSIIRVQRVQMANKKPIALITNYLLENIGKELLDDQETFTSLYQFIEEHHHIKLDSSKDRISAVSADFTQAQMLEVPVNTALIDVKRICYSNNKPISVDVLKIVGAMYEFEINLLNREG